jgi:hypothetical protein
MPATAQQRADLRADMGDTGNAFSDVELDRIWDRVGGASNDLTRHEAALALMARQLLANAAKLHDITAGQSSEKLSQVYDHLERLYRLYSPSLTAALGTKNEIVIAAIRPARRQHRQYPDGWNADGSAEDFNA